MKTKVSQKKQSGAALLTALVICTILSLVVMYYLSLTQQQTLLSARSQTWNTTIATTEAGLEEGLQHLNDDTANLTANGWSFNGSVYQSPIRTFANGSSYVSIIDMSVDPFNPAVTSLASANPPTFAYCDGGPFFADIDLSAGNVSSVARAVIVRCARGNLYIKGMVAKQTINMNGNGILTDSFDSTNPNESTGGQYDSTKYQGTNGDVAVNSSIVNGIGVGNANIYGTVNVGPGGSVAVGSNGGVGDYAYQAANPGSIEPGWSSDTSNFTFPDQIYPFSSGLPPMPGFVNTTNYIVSTNAVVGSSTYPNPVPPDGVMTNTAVLTVKNWPNQPNTSTNCDSNIADAGKNPPSLSCGAPWQNGNGNKNNSDWYYYPIASYTYTNTTYSYSLYSTNSTVTSQYYDHILYGGDYYLATPLSGKTLVLGPSRLVLPQGINMSGQDCIQIAQGGSVQIYAGAQANGSDSIGGNGIMNSPGFAVNCQLNFTPACKSLSIGGNGTIVSTVVAPEANVTMNGGGRTNTDFVGCLMANTITMNGHFSFHYDEALGRIGAMSRFIIQSWNEVPPASLPPSYFTSN
jgi:hypothetical protein